MEVKLPFYKSAYFGGINIYVKRLFIYIIVCKIYEKTDSCTIYYVISPLNEFLRH